jgi:ATP-dependent Zn protease
MATFIEAHSEGVPVFPAPAYTAAVIDEEVQKLLRKADDRAQENREAHRAEFDRLVEALLQKEELLYEETEEILGKPSAAQVDGRPPTEAIFAPGTQK